MANLDISQDANLATASSVDVNNDRLLIVQGGVLKDLAPVTLLDGYTLQLSFAATNPLDATNYYFAGRFSVIISTSITNMRMYVPKTGVLRAVYGRFSFVPGSNEQSSIYIRKNDTSDTLIVSNLDLSATPIFFNNTSMSLSLTAGDFITAKWVTPTWVTNPTTLDGDLLLYIE